MNISELKNHAVENNLETVDFTFRPKADMSILHGTFSIVNDEVVVHGQAGKRTEAQFAIEGFNLTVKETPVIETPVAETPQVPVEETVVPPVTEVPVPEITETPAAETVAEETPGA